MGTCERQKVTQTKHKQGPHKLKRTHSLLFSCYITVPNNEFCVCAQAQAVYRSFFLPRDPCDVTERDGRSPTHLLFKHQILFLRPE